MTHHGDPRSRGRLGFGLILVFLGLWFLLRNLGTELPGFGRVWPLLMVLAGIGGIVSHFRNRGEGGAEALIPGFVLLLLGLFFLSITLGPLEWQDLRLLWPMFPLLVGVANLAAWLFDRGRVPGLLASAGVLLTVGGVGLAFTYGLFLADWLKRGWPVSLVLVGGALVARSLLGRRP